MALKEFREIRGIVLLAAAGYALLAFAAMAPASPWNILAFFRLPWVCGNRWASRSAEPIRFYCIARPTAIG
jgi:hypothetical protein